MLGGVKAYVVEYQAEIEFTDDCCNLRPLYNLSSPFVARPLSVSEGLFISSPKSTKRTAFNNKRRYWF